MIRQGIIRLFLVELKMEWITRMKYIMAPVSAVNSTYHTNQGLLLIMIGYMFWNLGVVAMDIGTQVIESDAKSGILEIEMQSKYPLWLLVFIRNIVTNAFVVMYLIFLGVATSLFTNLKFSTILLAIIYVTILSMLTNLGMLGIGFIFGAGSLSFKRIGQWSILLQAAIILFSNVGIPLTTPLQLIVPFSGGIEIVRSLILNKPISVSELIITLIVNILWFIAGIVILNISVKNERKNGSFTVF